MNRKLAIALAILVVVSGLVVAKALSPPGDEVAAGVGAIPRPAKGGVVVDSAGYTIYRYRRDVPVAKRRTDPRVDPLPDRQLLNCDPGFPAGWLPVSYWQNKALRAVDDKLLGYIERANGIHQLTIGGCPVYRYTGDREPGQANGHSVDAAWSVLTSPTTIATRPRSCGYLPR